MNPIIPARCEQRASVHTAKDFKKRGSAVPLLWTLKKAAASDLFTGGRALRDRERE